MSVKQFGKKKPKWNPCFLAALSCDILKIEAWIMCFHGFMTEESQLNEIKQSFSERAQDFISCVFYIWEREKRSCCHASWYHSLAIDLSLFPSCAIYRVKETPEMNYHSESPWLCCHSPNWSAGIEVLRPQTLWAQPGSWEGDRNYPRQAPFRYNPWDIPQNPGILSHRFCFKPRT